MHTGLAAIILVSIVIPAADVSLSMSTDYQVSEVVRVLTPNLFECRLFDYKPAPFVRFRVSLTDADVQRAGIQTKEQLEQRLKSAGEIELRNIRFRTYFRVEADLWLDGKPVVVRPVSTEAAPDVKTDEHKPTNLTTRQLNRWQRPVVRRTVPIYRPVNIQVLLDTTVDCSMLEENTPLAEALAILSESVEPRLPLLVLWKDLQANALIEKDTLIGVEGFGRLKLRQVLDIVLRSVTGHGPKLVLLAEGGILTLGTHQAILAKREAKVYSATDLLALPSIAETLNQNGRGNSNRNLDRSKSGNNSR